MAGLGIDALVTKLLVCKNRAMHRQEVQNQIMTHVGAWVHSSRSNDTEPSEVLHGEHFDHEQDGGATWAVGLELEIRAETVS
jgi:hypothetical protein